MIHRLRAILGRNILRPPPDLSSNQLRRLGLKQALVGLVVFPIGLGWYFLTHPWADAIVNMFGEPIGDNTARVPWAIGAVAIVPVAGPMTLGYVLLMVGLSRALFGRAAEAKSALASLGRILFGLVATLGMVVLALWLSSIYSRS